MSRAAAEERLRDLSYTAHIAEDLEDLRRIAAALTTAGLVAEVLPGSLGAPAHVRTRDPDGGPMEYALNRDYLSAEGTVSVFGFAERNVLLDDDFDDLGDLPGQVRDPDRAVAAFLDWLR